MIIGAPIETYPDERRVALVPDVLPGLAKHGGIEILIERGAGRGAGRTDAEYEEQGARLAADKAELFAQADVILQVHEPQVGSPAAREEISLFRSDQTLIGLLNPLGRPDRIQQIADKNVTAFSLEMLPRISRAQSMDALSSMATVAGYKAVLIAAGMLGKLFPMMITAGGTITPARVFVIGAGVAGLQAIASAHRLGGVVQSYDVRPAVKEQVESLGAKFVELDLETDAAESGGGYAKDLGEDFYRRQQEKMAEVVSASDVVITTAAVPGKKAPILVTKEMAEAMDPGSVIVDLAAETGGNCELTKAGETTECGDVRIVGPVNLPATVPFHASHLFSRNVSAFLRHIVADGEIRQDPDDPIVSEPRLTSGGQVVNSRLQELLGQSDAAGSEGGS
jgi:NAD(P) transhydrogenase subunit alpha